MKNFIVVIPALNPTKTLIQYVQKLLDEQIPSIIVVNDGSNKECTPIFSELQKYSRCVVLHHDINRGKGQALKTAFQYVLKSGESFNIVTADCDGQHSIQDVLKIGEVVSEIKEGLVLGTRDFKIKHVPFRSLLGNILTNYLFQFLFNYPLKDTQTGLRGIPFTLLPIISNLLGDRYDYEMNVLIFMAKHKLPLKEIPIQTIYFNNNSNSYYHPLKDSIKILNTILFHYRTSNN